MRAEKVVKSLLEAAAGVTSLVGSRLYAVTRPESGPLPAVIWSMVSDVPYSTLNQAEGQELMEARIDVACQAKTAGEAKELLEQVRLAVNFKNGTINGVQVVAIVQSSTGPDLYDSVVEVYQQSTDFMISYYR